MKNLLFIFMLTCFTALSSYGQEINIQSMLQNQENRDEVYQTIMQDQAYMKEFMQQMHQNKKAMNMMGNNKGMEPMMQGQKMESMMQDSTSMDHMDHMDNMMQSMMQNPEMMQKMMRMMHQKGMMSDDCMKAGMMKMKDNGMQMKNRNKDKGMKKGSAGDDHPSHH